jgi:nitrate reductase gamma subunit
MNLHNFLYGVYPYIALSVFLLGSLQRFDLEERFQSVAVQSQHALG